MSIVKPELGNRDLFRRLGGGQLGMFAAAPDAGYHVAGWDTILMRNAHSLPAFFLPSR